jgi:hypothetical protein
MQDANTYDLTISTEYGLWGTIAGFLLLFVAAAVAGDAPVSGSTQDHWAEKTRASPPSPGKIDDYLDDLRQQNFASARSRGRKKPGENGRPARKSD